jgi:chromate transporter
VTEPVPAVPFRTALRAWITIALQSFGGPTGQIAVIHRVVVDQRRWLSEQRFLHALSYCMLLPGPEAQQLVTYTGWLLHGVRGGLTAGLLFVLPGFLSILALSLVYVTWRNVGPVAAVFFGLKPAVLAIVVEATVRLRRRAAADAPSTALAALAFLALFLLRVPFPLVVLAAAVSGALIGHRRPAWAAAEDGAPPQHPGWRPLVRATAVWLPIWLGPVAALLLLLGPSHVLTREAAFFSKVAVVTFGGAYAVLAYVAQRAVEVYHWLAPGEMLDGLGLAETTPGPLIMVVEFVGFLGAHRQSGTLPPLLAGTLGAVITTWVTFAPCFLFIFAGAPYVEYLRGQPRLRAALRGVMAAVVGVVLNLAVWFALHTLFHQVDERQLGPVRLFLPRWGSVEWRAALIAAVSLVAVFRYRVGVLPLLGGAALAGILLSV